MKILVSYRAIPQSPGWATGDMVVRAFRALGHEVDVHAKFYQKNLWVEGRPLLPWHQHEYDLFLFMECNDGDPQYTELKNIKARKTACWLFDTSYYPDHLKGLVDFFNFDWRFIANPLEIDRFQNAYIMPYACDPTLHYRSGKPKHRDVAIVGSDRKDRRLLQTQLRQAGINMDIVSGVFREDYVDDLASSKIIVNQNPPLGRGLLNMRFWETMAAGSVLINNDGDYHQDNGTEGEHFLIYRTIQDLADKCNLILSDNKLRCKIQSSGQYFVLDQHTYQHRCQEILSLVFPYESF